MSQEQELMEFLNEAFPSDGIDLEEAYEFFNSQVSEGANNDQEVPNVDQAQDAASENPNQEGLNLLPVPRDFNNNITDVGGDDLGYQVLGGDDSSDPSGPYDPATPVQDLEPGELPPSPGSEDSLSSVSSPDSGVDDRDPITLPNLRLNILEGRATLHVMGVSIAPLNDHLLLLENTPQDSEDESWWEYQLNILSRRIMTLGF